MSEIVVEPARRLPVVEQYDVVVVGGGTAGVAAALAAARNGARTALLEKEYGLGGLATLGNVLVYLPICDGMGNQVIGGLGEELLIRSVADLRVRDKVMGWQPVPSCWQPGGDLEERKSKRYDSRFNPYSFQMELEVMVAEAGVDLWYDTRLCGCLRQADRITHLIVENKDGRSAMACATVVDASGDADVCALAGEQTESLDSNVLAGWHYLLKDGQLSLRAWTKKFNVVPTREGAEGPLFAGDRARDVTAQMLGSRALIREHIAGLRAADPEAEIHPFALGSIPSFRMTRRLVSSYSLTRDDDHRWFDDCIGMTGDWRLRGPIFCVPLRSLWGEANHNLLAAGRCMSADITAWDVTRAIPACVMTGEAAGTAAAMAAAETAGDVHALPTEAIQQRLREQRGILEPDLVREPVTAVEQRWEDGAAPTH